MIRAARASDADWIAALWSEVIAETTATFTTDPKTAEAVGQLIASRPAQFLVIGQAGFATFGTFRDGPGYVDVREHSIYLQKSAKGAGQGRRLLHALEATGRAQGVSYFVGGISGENVGALAFHAALGYVEVGRMPGLGQKWGRRLDLVLVQKNLQE